MTDTIDQILKYILKGKIPSEIFVCEWMPENDINTLPYDEFYEAQIKRAKMTWEEYSDLELREATIGAKPELEKTVEEQIQEILMNSIKENRYIHLQAISNLKKDNTTKKTKKKRRRFKKELPPIQWRTSELSETEKNKVKKRAKGIAAYLKQFLKLE